MIDRTKELQQQNIASPSERLNEWESLRQANTEADIEMGKIANEKWMETFFEDVNRVQRGLADLQSKLPLIERLHGKILSSFQESEERKLHRECDEITDEASALAYSLNNMLTIMEKDVARQLVPDSTDSRLCYSQYSGLSRKLRTTVFQYQQIQKDYQEKQKSRFIRQYRIINPDASDSDISNVLTEEYRGPIFADSILSATMMDEAKRVLTEVKARHKEILSLSKSIVRLEKLFEELSLLVEQQDDLVNQVAYQTELATNYLGESNVVLGSAVKSAARYRRRRWCLVGLGVTLLAVLAIVIAVVIVPLIKNQS